MKNNKTKVEKVVWYKKIPLFIIPFFIALFFFYQVDYIIDCDLRSDRCIIQKKAFVFDKMKKDDEFYISDIASWKVIEKKKLEFINTGEFYLSLRLFNNEYIKLMQFPVDSKKQARKMYLDMTRGATYHNETDNKHASESAFLVFLLVSIIMAVFKYGIKRL